MEFQSSQAQFALDAQSSSMSMLSAWDNSQQRHPQPQPQPQPYLPVRRQHFAYNGFPISPVSPSSSPQENMMNNMGNQLWTPPTVTEIELMQLRRGLEPPIPAATACVAEHEPANQQAHFNFDFDFSLPHISLPQLPLPQYQQRQHHQQQRCSPPLPTPTSPSSSTLFATPPVTPPRNMSFRRESPSSSLKRSSSDDQSDTSTAPSTGTTKKRACMSMKDFVPPDVTGLSKREARLVKNRAAAFLSRQRKREEFELMEIRVAELERENVRLRELADGHTPSSPSPSSESSELELLRMQLQSSRQREVELVHRLEVLKHEQKVKTEASEPTLSDGTNSDAGTNSPFMAPVSFKNIVANPKGGASLGLMVLLCALPSLLSHPSSQPRSTLPTSQSFLDTIQWDNPSFFPAATSGNDDVPSWDLDYPGPNSGSSGIAMDVDYNDVANTNEDEEWKKLELGLEGANDMGLSGLGLGALDISFATRRTRDGKIRVRVHSSPSTSSQSSSSEPMPQSNTEQATLSVNDQSNTALSLPSPPQSETDAVSHPDGLVNPLAMSFVDTDPLGPFLGAGSSPTGAFFEYPNQNNFTLPSDISGADIVNGTDGLRAGERRRVRIALRSFPQPGGEGGEWEVEVR
ncbi:uncharacterized protein FOMMEDRAFT_169806 [Fomitiporia mediterranea MF3/22]|uniref:uncharacterized protein n=1 Tax=Fomitiporia mediterranea (strain MF3/22) TaxID=694068 RepID=UPI00044077CB|nr:uncharacterized protein FOMMEDRAFT_169806 [Fomitiporia mediterranea MF3/22]EJD01760.1 hypothetical protein FOMMEDRAFT_169806 [Fomitiporia mediterranea MF3/22]